MNKTELVAEVAKRADMSNVGAGRALEAVIGSISGALKKGDSVVITGFGTFTVKQRAARTGRNPQTGEQMQIKASKAPSFKAGKVLKDSVK